MSRSLSEMNPLVSIAARQNSGNDPDEDFTQSEELIQGYNLVLVVGKPIGSLINLDNLCRKNKIAFLAAVSRGTQAIFFQDAGQHSFQPPVGFSSLIVREAWTSDLDCEFLGDLQLASQYNYHSDDPSLIALSEISLLQDTTTLH